MLRAQTSFCAGVKEPDSVNKAMGDTISLHAKAKGTPFVAIEMRQDLIGDTEDQHIWVSLLTAQLWLAITRSGILARRANPSPLSKMCPALRRTRCKTGCATIWTALPRQSFRSRTRFGAKIRWLGWKP